MGRRRVKGCSPPVEGGGGRRRRAVGGHKQDAAAARGACSPLAPGPAVPHPSPRDGWTCLYSDVRILKHL